MQTWDCSWGKAPLHQNQPAVDIGKLRVAWGRGLLKECHWERERKSHSLLCVCWGSSFSSLSPLLNTVYVSWCTCHGVGATYHLPLPLCAPSQEALHYFRHKRTFCAQLKMNVAERKMINDKVFLADVGYIKRSWCGKTSLTNGGCQKRSETGFQCKNDTTKSIRKKKQTPWSLASKQQLGALWGTKESGNIHFCLCDFSPLQAVVSRERTWHLTGCVQNQRAVLVSWAGVHHAPWTIAARAPSLTWSDLICISRCLWSLMLSYYKESALTALVPKKI